MSDDPRHALGRDAERLAQAWLEARGLSLVCANWRGRRGELDLVMRDRGIIAVIEVRARIGRPHDDARASVDRRKAHRLTSAIREYLCFSGLGDSLPVRVDLVTVCGPRWRPTLRWWRNAVRIVL
ncbi:MAG: YraN family protein [Gammaproteobacteria bacterium]